MGISDRGNYQFSESGFGLPRCRPEDSVEYTLHVVDSTLKSQDDTRKLYDAILHESLKVTKKLLEGFIWNCESFNLKIQTDNERTYLHGRTNYGDSLEDEWLIVYILKELSKEFSQLWIKVVDEYGEFLLIEAASALPRWLNPEIADNRVWIHNDKLYIIPPHATCSSSEPYSKTPISRPLGLEESLQIIHQAPEALINSPLIEKEAFYRLQDYPQQISASIHYTSVKIPRKLAYILQKNPASISPAVEAFYLRDPISLKFIHTEQTKLLFPPKDLVIMSTQFTKLRFAQLKSQEISTPLSWKKQLEDAKRGEMKSYEQLELGMKLACGFEMLMKDPHYSDNCFIENINLSIKNLVVDSHYPLPSDAEILHWNDKYHETDDSWMNIDFRDFERELSGKSGSNNTYRNTKNFGSGFGDSKTQADLRKLVERFESFLDDEKASSDGVELDDMDVDDDQDSFEDDSNDEDENKEITLNCNEFSRLMREIIEMPSETKDKSHEFETIENSSTITEKHCKMVDDDANKLAEIMENMEKELKEANVLNLDLC